jgi:hypothetical protein
LEFSDDLRGDFTDSSIIKSARTIKPYCASLTLSDGRQLPALYLGGGAYEQAIPCANIYKAAASYHQPNNKKYVFLNRDEKLYQEFDSIPAIIYRTRKAPAEKIGGMVASGMHFEAAIENSKLLNYFADPNNKQRLALTEDEVKVLRDAHSQAIEFYTDLLREALR